MTYADSSFLVSQYLPDSHSLEVGRRMVGKPSIWVTPLHRAEIAHAIYLHIFYRKFSRADANLAWSEFEQDYAQGIWARANLPERAWERTIELARRHGPELGVRTLDSLHVACALELNARRFWTFDERQAKLAEAVGLSTKP